MKTASIYSSQKQQQHNQLLYQHHNQPNPTSLTPNPYLHSSSTTNMTKKSSTMKKFQYCINANTIQNVKTPKENHYHFLNDMNCNNGNNNTMVMKPKKPTQKPVHNVQKNIINYFVKQYQKIISNLTDYYKYYQWMLMKEIEKHDAYYGELIKVIEGQKKRSQMFLVEQVKTLSEKILLQKAALQNKIALLENNNLKHYEKEKMELESQRYLELPLFEVGLRRIDKFKTQIKKFLFEVKTEEEVERQAVMERESLEEAIQLTESVKTQKKEKQCPDNLDLQIEQIPPINSQPQDTPIPQPPTPKPVATIMSLQDKDLYCDEDIENILKNSKVIKKKRYEFRQDAIPQQSQSHQDSLNISNIKSIC